MYGMPVMTLELMEKEKKGEVVFGGCVIEVDGNQPSWHCTKCGTDFYKA
jgi:hypothetical protein